MSSFSGLGIGLSFLFGCIVMGFAAELFYLFCARKRISNPLTKIGKQLQVAPNSRNQEINEQNQDLELGGTNNNDSSIKLEGYREDYNAELELMRLHNLRFLSTIKEETKEDLESADGRSRKCSKSRSFSDLTQELSLNPLFESEIKSVKSSPPPKFKFLRDAEEKLLKRLIEEAEKRKNSSTSTMFFDDKVVSMCDQTTYKSHIRAAEIGTHV